MSLLTALLCYLIGSVLTLEFVVRYGDRSRQTTGSLVTLVALWPMVWLLIITERTLRRWM